METQYFTLDDVRYIVAPDSLVPDNNGGTKSLREHLRMTDEQYAAALAEWQATGAQE